MDLAEVGVDPIPRVGEDASLICALKLPRVLELNPPLLRALLLFELSGGLRATGRGVAVTHSLTRILSLRLQRLSLAVLRPSDLVNLRAILEQPPLQLLHLDHNRHERWRLGMRGEMSGGRGTSGSRTRDTPSGTEDTEKNGFEPGDTHSNSCQRAPA